MTGLPYDLVFEKHLIQLGFKPVMRTDDDSQRAYGLDLAGKNPLSDRFIKTEPLFELARHRYGNGDFRIVLADFEASGRTSHQGWAVEFGALCALIESMGFRTETIQDVWHFRFLG